MPKPASSENAKLVYWEIIAIVHTFVGTVLIESISPNMLFGKAGLLYTLGINLFISNLLLIGFSYDWDKKEFRKYKTLQTRKKRDYLEIMFLISFLTITLLILAKIRQF